MLLDFELQFDMTCKLEEQCLLPYGHRYTVGIEHESHCNQEQDIPVNPRRPLCPVAPLMMMVLVSPSHGSSSVWTGEGTTERPGACQAKARSPSGGSAIAKIIIFWEPFSTTNRPNKVKLQYSC
jgi:hypothetical protein